MEALLVVGFVIVIAIVRYKTIQSGKVLEKMADEMYKDEKQETKEEEAKAKEK